MDVVEHVRRRDTSLSAGACTRRLLRSQTEAHDERVSQFDPKRILAIVKTYPTPSQAYGETVCCAGVDLDTGRWVRMYPITFRRLADKTFAKYQVIECLATRSPKDSRPESLHVDQDSIRLSGSPMPAGEKGWVRRMALLPPPSRSLEEVQDAQAANSTSIGMLRPARIDGLVMENATPWTEKQRTALAQQHLDLGAATSKQLRELVQIPFAFSYRFTCTDDRCTGHKLQILDWEIGQAYREWSRTDPGRWEEMIRQKYESELPARDLHLVVGNLAAWRQTFVIIGLVAPPRVEMDGGYVQESLELMGQQRPVTGRGIGLEAEQADALGVEHREDAPKLFPDKG